MPRPTRRRLTECEQATVVASLTLLLEALRNGNEDMDSFECYFIDDDGYSIDKPTADDVDALRMTLMNRALFAERSYGESAQEGDLL